MSGEKVSQELFLSVKERLDYHHLPTNFPIEATPLLSKVLKLVDGSKLAPQQPLPAGLAEGLSSALRHEMGHVIKENNKLHMNLMAAREQIQSLEHRVHKAEANRHAEGREAEQLAALKGQREQELLEELREVRYKYNELMDFLHEDPQAEREYIKRLLKHRHELPDRLPPPTYAHAHNSPPRDKAHSSQRVKELETKLKNREAEILRLQNLIEYDGLDMNKIIKRFQDSLVENRLKVADNKINFLEDSLDKATRENRTMKSNNGSKEALRAEVEKCHALIRSLRQENETLRRNAEEQGFDVKKQLSHQDRKVSKAKAEKQQAQDDAKNKEHHAHELQKRISFLEKETQQLRESQDQAGRELVAATEARTALTKKNEELRVFYEYELDTFKKKLQEVEFEAQEARASAKQAAHEADILRREGDLKSEAIANLEKIVNELLKKNSLLADNTVGTLQSLKRSEDIEAKRQLLDLQQQLLHAQNERHQLHADLTTLEHRYGTAYKDAQRAQADLAYLNKDLAAKDVALQQAATELEELRIALRKAQSEAARAGVQAGEAVAARGEAEERLRGEAERAGTRERTARVQLREAEVRLAEEQGALEVARLKLEEREDRIKQLERLLSETVEHSKAHAARAADLDQQLHDLAREKHRLAKKYEETRKEAEDFRSGSLKAYEAAIGEEQGERARLREETRRLAEAQEVLQIRYEEVSGMLGLVRREKELQEVEKVDLLRQNEHLQLRLAEMQDIERALVLENQSLRTLARRL